jgi:hypothetical protein
MTHDTLAKLLDRLLDEMEGTDGFWHGQRDEVTVYVVSDLEHDRMRIMSPIGELRVTDSGFLSILLQANFDRALDAKYALRKKELWAVFMHPLSTVVPDDLGLYVDQVVRLVKNTGTTYASSDLIFGVEGDERLDLEYEADGDGDTDEDELLEIDGHEEDSDDDDDDDDDSEGDDFDDFEAEEEDEDEGWRKGGTGFSP